jgi:hypothetical protein
MAARRHRRLFTELDRDELLLGCLLFREALGRALIKAPVLGPEYRAVRTAGEAVDDLVGALTGDRELFWGQPHTAGEDASQRPQTPKDVLRNRIHAKRFALPR